MEMCQPSLNDNKTTTTIQQDAPVSDRRYPNRSQIVGLASLKLVLNLVLILVLIFTVHLCFIFGRPSTLYHVVLLCIIIFIVLVDMVIVLITIISIYAKNQGIMEMYKYSIYIFGPIPILCFLGLFIIFGRITIFMTYISLPTFFFSLMIHVYLNYAMKNEVRMLRSNTCHL